MKGDLLVMRDHETRKERHERKIFDFLSSDEESLPLRLYGHEIKTLSSRHPEINIKQVSQYRQSKLFDCTVTKVQQ